tara:strand:- start:188 stop:427 length:240 start_codon:yes stop_codon:yes gene_type:complete
MDQERELESILFTVVALDEVDSSKVLVPIISPNKVPHELDVSPPEFILDVFGVPLVERVVLKDDTLLHIVLKIYLLRQN